MKLIYIEKVKHNIEQAFLAGDQELRAQYISMALELLELLKKEIEHEGNTL